MNYELIDLPQEQQVTQDHQQWINGPTTGTAGKTRPPVTSVSNILITADVFSPAVTPWNSSSTTTKLSCHSTSGLYSILISAHLVLSSTIKRLMKGYQRLPIALL